MTVPSRTRLLAAACVGAVAFVFAFHQIYDPDFGFHLATGRWILANGRIPTADPFSFDVELVARLLAPPAGIAPVHADELREVRCGAGATSPGRSSGWPR